MTGDSKLKIKVKTYPNIFSLIMLDQTLWTHYDTMPVWESRENSATKLCITNEPCTNVGKLV